MRGGVAEERGVSEKSDADIPRVSVEVARDRAVLLQQVYLSTLDVIHHRYFHAEKAVIPARAMEDIFKDMQKARHIHARWIAVNLKPMGVDHEPKSDFEKHSVLKIKIGSRTVEAVDSGYYRRTVAIPLIMAAWVNHHGEKAESSAAEKPSE